MNDIMYHLMNDLMYQLMNDLMYHLMDDKIFCCAFHLITSSLLHHEADKVTKHDVSSVLYTRPSRMADGTPQEKLHRETGRQ